MEGESDDERSEYPSEETLEEILLNETQRANLLAKFVRHEEEKLDISVVFPEMSKMFSKVNPYSQNIIQHKGKPIIGLKKIREMRRKVRENVAVYNTTLFMSILLGETDTFVSKKTFDTVLASVLCYDSALFRGYGEFFRTVDIIHDTFSQMPDIQNIIIGFVSALKADSR